MDATAVLVGPIVSAFELEGSRHFNAPAQVCAMQTRRRFLEVISLWPGGRCERGLVCQGWLSRFFPVVDSGAVDHRCRYSRLFCLWYIHSSALSSFFVTSCALSATNFYVDLGATPLTGEEFHLPKVTRVDKTLSVVTYAQGAWDLLDPVDSGFGSVSANELVNGTPPVFIFTL